MMEYWRWPPAYDESYRPSYDQEYWFPIRETMAPEERDEAIVARIREIMRYAYTKAPFYRRKWEEAGVEPDDIRSLRDFEGVPVVTKEELRQAQVAHPPFGDYACIPRESVARIFGSSGTTGRPTAFGVSLEDWRAIANAHARAMWAMGIRPSDLVFIGSVFSLYIGSWGALLGAERLGASTFPFGAGLPGQTLRAIEWMREMQPSVFYGTPSYALRIAEVSAEHGIDPKGLGLRILFFSGEPGASIPPIRTRIAEAFDGRVFDSGSMAEATPWMSLAETTAGCGMLCWQDIVYTEVVNTATMHRVPFGAEGTLVYTHLERLGQPMIRLMSGDLTTWESGPSPCGRTYPVLPRGIYGRLDDQFTVRGENVQPSAIDEVLRGITTYGGEHRIIITREEAMDVLVVQVEHGESVQTHHDEQSFKETVENALRHKLGVATQVVPVPPNSLERTEFKARRVIDRRDLFRELV